MVIIRYSSIICEIIAFIISLIVFKKNRGSFIQWMSLYLFYTLFTELSAAYLYYHLHKPTTALHLWYHVVLIVFYTYVFKNLLVLNRLLEISTWSISSILVLSFMYIFYFLPNYVEYKFKLQIAEGFYLSILSVIYLYQEFMDDNPEEFLLRKAGFWIAAGILLFYSGESIVLALHPTASKNHIFILGLPVHIFFANILSVFLYTCLSIAMIVWKRPKTTIS